MQVYLALLRRNPGFRNLWFARVVSNLGDWFNLLASAALIANLSGGGTAISFLFLARFLPLFVTSPFAGLLADRFERRTLLIWTDLLRAAVVLGFLLVDRPERIWLLYLLTTLQFVFSALFTPTQQAYLPAVVDADDLVTANALDSLTWSVMLAIGALLGGIATALLGVQAAFLLDALTFLLSAWFLTRIGVRSRGQPLAAPGRHRPLRSRRRDQKKGWEGEAARPGQRLFPARWPPAGSSWGGRADRCGGIGSAQAGAQVPASQDR